MDKISIGKRIKQLREALGLNKQELANMAGTSDVTIGFWESGRHTPTGNKLVSLATALGTTAEYLIHGSYKSTKAADDQGIRDREAKYQSEGRVPLISWVQAGEWTETHDLYSPGDAEEWLPCPVRHSPDTYALRVKGDSMESPIRGDRSYHPGTIIFGNYIHNSLYVILTPIIFENNEFNLSIVGTLQFPSFRRNATSST